MSNAPVCHISTGSRPIQQPKPTLLPTIPVAVDLPSALAAINQLKLLIQMLAGQQAVTGPVGRNGIAGLAGAAGAAGSPGAQGKKGKDGKNPKDAQWKEDVSQRVTKKKRIFQDNDTNSPNYVDIKQINRVVWVDDVTGSQIVWERGPDGED